MYKTFSRHQPVMHCYSSLRFWWTSISVVHWHRQLRMQFDRRETELMECSVSEVLEQSRCTSTTNMDHCPLSQKLFENQNQPISIWYFKISHVSQDAANSIERCLQKILARRSLSLCTDLNTNQQSIRLPSFKCALDLNVRLSAVADSLIFIPRNGYTFLLLDLFCLFFLFFSVFLVSITLTN